ncbi:hypothetical protein Ciccas_005732 [Cichlidogyrus casuarinus]|uniref:Voltage-dependent calcium channel alpha-2/delta subunit conserved region domain-containing protein n=1 Tax=Cichlidogyrus casuarinus TaxID=1844966 RepID=A0ABD2Q832_9PLAT
MAERYNFQTTNFVNKNKAIENPNRTELLLVVVCSLPFSSLVDLNRIKPDLGDVEAQAPWDAGVQTPWPKGLGYASAPHHLTTTAFFLIKTLEKVPFGVQNGWMPDPPNVDILEVEFNNGSEKTQLRNSLINQTETIKVVDDFINVADEIHTYKLPRTYSCGAIENSQFGLCSVNPLYNKCYLKGNPEKPLEVTGSAGSFKISGTDINRIGKDIRPILFTNLLFGCPEYHDRLLNKQEEKKQPDAEKEKVPNSSPAPSVPNEIVSAASLAHDSLDNLFGIPIIATKEFIRLNGSQQSTGNHSSLELVPLSRKPRETESPPKALEQVEEEAGNGEPMINILRNNKDSDVKDVSVENENQTSDVTVFETLSVSTGDRSYKTGILGVTIKREFFDRQVQELSQCRDSNSVCYLLEDGGYVVSVSNQERRYETGFFFGYLKPPVMQSMIGKVYHQLEEFDYQASCAVQDTTDAKASSAIRAISVSPFSTRRKKYLLCEQLFYVERKSKYPGLGRLALLTRPGYLYWFVVKTTSFITFG